ISSPFTDHCCRVSLPDAEVRTGAADMNKPKPNYFMIADRLCPSNFALFGMKTNYRRTIVQIQVRCLALLALAPVAIFVAATLSLRAAPGDLDPLDAGIVNGSEISATAVQPDGKIIIAGEFSSVLGVPRLNIARLNSDGTLDMGFDPHVYGLINSVA